MVKGDIMLWPGVKKLGKELGLKRTDFEAVGIIKNCFVKMYDGHNMKVLELYVPEMDDDDKAHIVRKLESNKIKKHEWFLNGVKIIFVEMVKPYSMQKIKDLLEELVNYFSSKYPAGVLQCQHCGQPDETEIYGINNVSVLICSDCYKQAERKIENENLEQKNIEGNYLWGFLGAIIFAIPGILLAILLFVFLNSLAAASAVVYILLGIIGYKKFKGKISPVGAVVIVIAGIIMVGAGTIIAYSVFWLVELYKETGIIFMDGLFYILEMPEIQSELRINILLSYVVSAVYFAFQLNLMVKEWKNQKVISKTRDI